jgi:hypothetical protein
MSPAKLAGSLRDWLSQFDTAEIVTDCPASDFPFLRVALDENRYGWPKNVETGAVLFQPDEEWLETHFSQSDGFRHHALWDARALRLAWLAKTIV